MQPATLLSVIGALPEYRELIHKRHRVATPLTILILVAYFAFILMVAYTPHILAMPIVAGGVTTVGIVFGLGLILITFGITAFFVWYANSRLEKLLHIIQQKVVEHGE
jgi:uncharacterized membrane protein (DUF485 family)